MTPATSPSRRWTLFWVSLAILVTTLLGSGAFWYRAAGVSCTLVSGWRIDLGHEHLVTLHDEDDEPGWSRVSGRWYQIGPLLFDVPVQASEEEEE